MNAHTDFNLLQNKHCIECGTAAAGMRHFTQGSRCFTLSNAAFYRVLYTCPSAAESRGMEIAPNTASSLADIRRCIFRQCHTTCSPAATTANCPSTVTLALPVTPQPPQESSARWARKGERMATSQSWRSSIHSIPSIVKTRFLCQMD